MKRMTAVLAVLLLTAGQISAKIPVIGISGYTDGAGCEAGMTYIKAVRMAGGAPLIIPVTSDDAQIETVLETIDGLVMTGGEDFDPLKWYGEEPRKELGEVVPSRDEFDVKLIRAAVAKGIPVLGICRGEQLMAVAFGGSLWQDIPSQVAGNFVKHRQSPTSSAYGTHSISLEKGSSLSTILATEHTIVNSFHHQAIKDVPDGFRVAARSADGVIEAVERSGEITGTKDGKGWILGVQFHPEALVANGGNKDFLPIFQTLVWEASKK